jgi:hypothetical protein
MRNDNEWKFIIVGGLFVHTLRASSQRWYEVLVRKTGFAQEDEEERRKRRPTSGVRNNRTFTQSRKNARQSTASDMRRTEQKTERGTGQGKGCEGEGQHGSPYTTDQRRVFDTIPILITTDHRIVQNNEGGNTRRGRDFSS